jgi:PDZ domain
MSQCFSGGFAFLPEAVRTLPKPAPRTAPWRGPVCGYFATTPDRPAYGCYPESHAEDRMGHAFTFIDALSAARDPSASLADLHADVLLRDQSPDVPLRSSDLYLSDVIDTAAEAAGTDPEVFADRLLAGRPPSRERATADRVARAFALAPATSLADVRARLNEAAALRDRVDQHQGLWEDALADANRAALERFVTAQPNWQSRLRRPILARLAEEPRRQLTRELVEALDKFTRGDARFDEQIAALVERADKAAPLAYRMDVREAVLLRMRLLLLSAAGRAHVESAGTPAERAELATLDECEGLTLPVAPAKTRPEPPPPYRPAAADEAMAEQIHPSWLGIAFRAPAPALRRRQGLSVGAAVITAVVPGSPAARAGLAPGDVVLGPRGRSFDREGEIRAFTMLAGTQKPIDLEVLRQGKKRTVTVALAAFPSGK